ncbi:Exodeoxyribonuclease VII large subunit [Verrucomicrobium sp. GAS474]|uniref:exodeoxyribonuclease VII large subunit n=1 Tax=Verrucomicrobium sp. GAS474 TaxID=1882831 RepID=UPI00087CDE86|nr:exodeoxyribonuclease VII large subunit [Verrucomicrobium sp. GAS474]SDT86358.1 Exodeoxyribonuclease VII large subunit [Verrucomicrobium sp. GAS474]
MAKSGTLDLWTGGGEEEPESSLAARPEAAPVVALTVGQITKRIRSLLEQELGEVWVRGEISNLKLPPSGHVYFTLKDADGVLNAVMFRNAAMRLSAPLRDGQAVLLRGRITVYEARGQYQILVEEVRAEGLGTLQERFEALKRKLMAEGLFEIERKRDLPVFPERVGIVTSLQGAVIQDFCRVLGRRAPGIGIQVRGVRVQGVGAAEEIAEAVAAFSREGGVDLIVVARGGGSLEDLWAFNEEVVARALAASLIPTVSAVGHETDFTIADFVADLRAPTPSAAAELISRDWEEWRGEVAALKERLRREVRAKVEWERERLTRLRNSPVFREPRRYVERMSQRVDDLASGLGRGLRHAVAVRRGTWEGLRGRLAAPSADPRTRIARLREAVGHWEARLRTLGPEGTLARGYALVLDGEGKLVRKAGEVKPGQGLKIRFGDGDVGAKAV